MGNKYKLIVFICLLLQCLSACSSNSKNTNILIIGSAEQPDPVLLRVLELEKKGLVNNVIIRESFPVQIDISAPESIIKELKTIPIKYLPDDD